VSRLGADRIHTHHRCVGVTQDAQGALVHFVQGSGGAGLLATNLSCRARVICVSAPSRPARWSSIPSWIGSSLTGRS
jgi:hypothetical protein